MKNEAYPEGNKKTPDKVYVSFPYRYLSEIKPGDIFEVAVFTPNQMNMLCLIWRVQFGTVIKASKSGKQGTKLVRFIGPKGGN